MAVIARTGLQVAWGKLPRFGHYRARVSTYLATPEHRPMLDFDHKAMIAHARAVLSQIGPLGTATWAPRPDCS